MTACISLFFCVLGGGRGGRLASRPTRKVALMQLRGARSLRAATRAALTKVCGLLTRVSCGDKKEKARLGLYSCGTDLF